MAGESRRGEKPFIGYQATVALLNAGRRLEGHRDDVARAVEMAMAIMNNLTFKDPNQLRTLASAKKEVRETRPAQCQIARVTKGGKPVVANDLSGEWATLEDPDQHLCLGLDLSSFSRETEFLVLHRGTHTTGLTRF